MSTQWVGGDVTARYAESRERAAAAMENDRLAAAGTSKLHVEPPLPRMNGTNGHAANGHANGHANGGANGNGVTTNGAMKAANGINGNGAANGLKNGWAEGMGSEPEEREVEINGPRRSSRRRKTRVAS